MVKGLKQAKWDGHTRRASGRKPMDVYAAPRVQTDAVNNVGHKGETAGVEQPVPDRRGVSTQRDS